MIDYLLPPFGQINLTSLNGEYRAVIQLANKEIRIDINFKNTAIEKAAMDNVKNFIDNISKFDKQNLDFIEKDFNDDNCKTVKEYIEFHIEEALDQEKLTQLIDYQNNEITAEKQFLSKLRLERVGLYPDGKYGTEHFAVFDYTPEGNVYFEGRRTITDEILVICTDKNGKMAYITMES